MLRRYTFVFLLLASCSTLLGQIVSVDSLINRNNELTIVYTISDSLDGFKYSVDLFAIVGRDTLSMKAGKGYPLDSLTAGTYRMRWSPVEAMGRYRGPVQVMVSARPGFRVTSGPEPSYKLGQEAKLRWYGGGAINEQFDLSLLQLGTIVSTTELQYGVLSARYQFAETLKAGESYSFRMVGRTTGITYDSPEFTLTKIKERKWYVYAIPGAILAGGLVLLLLDGPIDPPQSIEN
ncbi:MAG: hypothetical protein NWR72_18570 [Bacteroidia bacterium]|nr:hypothetical protein [Bacteroidia bacterium]